MEELNSIEKYRKQEKQAKIKRRVTLLTIILALAILLISVDIIFKKMSENNKLPTYDAAELSKGFPITMPTSATYRMTLMGSDISLLTDTGLYIYDDGGNRILNFSHAYNSAVSQTNSTRTLVYDAGGNQFLCATRKAVLFQNEISEKITFGQIADNNNVAIIVDSDRYASVLYIYDNNGKQIYSVSTTDKITACRFLPDGSGCVISTVSANNGIAASRLTCYKFKNAKEPKWSKELNGSIVFNINTYSDTNVSAICDNAVYTFDKKGELASKIEYTNNISDITLSQTNVGILLDDSVNRQKKLIFINNSGETVLDITAPNAVFDITASGSDIYTFDGKTIAEYNNDGAVKRSLLLDSEYDYFTISSDDFYLLSDTVIGRAKTDDLEKEKASDTDKSTDTATDTEAE